MKRLLIATLIFILSNTFEIKAFEGLHYRIIQSWEDTSVDNRFKQRSWWGFNRFSTLSECEAEMMKEIYNSRYSTNTIEVLNIYDDFEYRKVIYQKRNDGTLKVQWGCLDFKN